MEGVPVKADVTRNSALVLISATCPWTLPHKISLIGMRTVMSWRRGSIDPSSESVVLAVMAFMTSLDVLTAEDNAQ